MLLIHISVLKDYLKTDFTADIPWIDKSDYQRIIDGFVFLMILYGNDFIPRLPFLYSCVDNILILLDTYRLFLRDKKTFLINGYSLDLTAFQWILYHIEKKSKSSFAGLKDVLLESLQQIVEWNIKTLIKDTTGEQEMLHKYESLLKEISENRYNGSYESYRSLYYRVKCGIDDSENIYNLLSSR